MYEGFRFFSGQNLTSDVPWEWRCEYNRNTCHSHGWARGSTRGSTGLPSLKINWRFHFLFLFLLLCTLSLLLLSTSVQDQLTRGQGQSATLKTHQRHSNGCFNTDFPVLIDQPQVCATEKNQTIDIVFFIPSRLNGAEERNVIRKTCSSVSKNNTSNFPHVFLLGVTGDRLRMGLITEKVFAAGI